MSIEFYEPLSADHELDVEVLEWRKLGALVLDETLREGEQMIDVLIPEANEEIIATLEDRPAGEILLACGDDRGITEDSAKYLVSEGLPADQPYARYFGGIFGFTRIAMVSVAAQNGAAGLKKLTGGLDFVSFTGDVAPKIIERGRLIPTSHSSVNNEHNRAKLSPDSSSAIACAYALNAGEVTHIAASNRNGHRLSKAEFVSLFGPSVDADNMDIVADANTSFASIALGDNPREYSVTRHNLLENDIPTMILQGDHARSMETFVLLNFSRDKLTNPSLAESRGMKFYGADLTQTAEAIMKTFPEQKLDPEIILAAMIIDITATRTALAAHDGTANPDRIALVKYGDPEEALDYLRSL